MLLRAIILVGLLTMLQPHPVRAEEPSAAPELDVPSPQARADWQSIQDYEDNYFIAVAGPPTLEDMSRAQAAERLYLSLIDNFDDLDEDGDDPDYQFIVEALFDPEDSARPASLRNEDDHFAATGDNNNESLNSLTYFDSIRPSYLPGVQIKPRDLDADKDKTENKDMRSLFADITKAKVEDILGTDVKPVSLPPDEKTASTDKQSEGLSGKAGTINAPPKHVMSPDEETMNNLKRAVQELGLANKLNFVSGADGHNVVESKGIAANEAQVGQPKAKDIAAVKPASKNIAKKKPKPKRAYKRKTTPEQLPQAVPAPEAAPKHESLFDLLF